MTLTIYANTGYAGGAINPDSFGVDIDFSDGVATLSWDAVAGALSYSVYAGLSDTTMVPVTQEQLELTAVIDGLNQDAAYCFQVVAQMGNGRSIGSAMIRNNTIPVPAPAAPVASSCNASALLSWTASAGAVSYNVYQGTAPGAESGTPVQTGIIGTSTTVTGLANGTTYYFTVKAVAVTGQKSAASNEVSAMPSVLNPPALVATPRNTAVQLNWSGGSGQSSYTVLMGTAPGAETPLQSGIVGTSLLVTGLVNNTAYYFKVESLNSCGQGATSNEVSATPALVAFDPAHLGPDMALSNGNRDLTRQNSNDSAWRSCFSVTSHNTGKVQCELEAEALGLVIGSVMFGPTTGATSLSNYVGSDAGSWACQSINNGSTNLWHNGAQNETGGGYTQTRQAIVLDIDAGKGWFVIKDTLGNILVEPSVLAGPSGDPTAGTFPTFTFPPGTTFKAGASLFSQPAVVRLNNYASQMVIPLYAGYSAWDV